MRSIREKKSWVNDFDAAKTLFEDLEVIYEFYKEDEASLEDLASSSSYISQLLRPNVPIKQLTRLFTWLFTRLWTHRVEQSKHCELAQPL